MGRVTITVTDEHIKAGKRRSDFWCPIALAIAETTGEEMGSVGVGESAISIPSLKFVLRTPQKVKSFIRAFDCGRPVEPFTFEIPI